MRVIGVRALLLLLGMWVALPPGALAQDSLPLAVAGTWRIVRVLPVRSGSACWTEEQAKPLVGSLLTYSASALRWRGGVVPLTGVTTRLVGTAELAQEESRGDRALTLADLGFHERQVREVNLQHEDADVTGATTEVPGDSVLMAGPGRLVLSACGVYLEARRPARRAPGPASAASGSAGPGSAASGSAESGPGGGGL